ncbi:LacI family DNA-binding transcriptional regulator [Yoonia sediminilitoris]|uniref:LacI family transcriptional regulator n=1 Tax=Yoonia sediminilitoris TaxID=1286148 RepID=A0A2T6K4G1_9RHOB|nr:LacI family DNA-binding transcriptional regulator [Yoonia sediminilitoris]PUB09542.1 LacI family transcriptional regulator [Yoonia sediminilitoris]RCW89497.1 LacI family transcriptional regulator [Yoonia sediminilitoris]
MAKSRRVTLKDVSAASGLSLITVSRALRHPETVQEETRKKIHKTIEEIGYVPNLTARSLVSSRSNMIGVVVPILTSSLFADFAQGAETVLRQANLQMLLGVSQRSKDQEAEAVRTFIARQADAIIVTGFTHSSACRKLLEAFGGPVVETWNLRPEALDISVGYSNYDASAGMTRYLIEKGYRNIATVGGAFENNDQATDRQAGFLQTMQDAGRSVPPENILAVPNPTTIESGGPLILSLLDRPNPPDAVFFQAELPAQGAMMACLSRGIRIPEDVAIAGFGDLSISGLMPVPMTTIRVRAQEIGQRAAEHVLQRLNDGVEQPLIDDVGFELMIRESA